MNTSTSVESQVKAYVESFGIERLQVNLLTRKDLGNIAWSGSLSHIEHVRRALDRDDIDYLTVCAPGGKPMLRVRLIILRIKMRAVSRSWRPCQSCVAWG